MMNISKTICADAKFFGIRMLEGNSLITSSLTKSLIKTIYPTADIISMKKQKKNSNKTFRR